MKQAERALQVWQVLICAARNRQTITYGQLAQLIGMGENPVVVTPFLPRVLEYCERNNLPPLTYLVVGKWTGKPGTEFPDLDSERERAFNYPWFSLRPVQVNDFEAQEQEEG
jgi:alkylated DNA nucleotide flippase Atl1